MRSLAAMAGLWYFGFMDLYTGQPTLKEAMSNLPSGVC